MSTPRGGLVPTRWSPLRRELERLLQDGVWHETDALYFQVERFIDPRIAARSWAREYEHNRGRRIERGIAEEVTPASTMLLRDYRHALEVGRWRVYWDCIRMLRRYGHAETQVWGGRRRVRLVTPPVKGA